MRAKLRVCASCEWVFKTEDDPTCPKCEFGSYGAYSVYGGKAYRYLANQQPWFDKKMATYSYKLLGEIRDARSKKTNDLSM